MKQRSERTRFPPESETVEWKQSLSEWKEIVETCAAFATAHGGTVYVGISPKGERVGVQIGKGTIEDLANKIKLNTDPPQFPSIEILGPERSAVIQIHVEQNPIKPVWALGRPVKRVGRTNQLLRRDEAHRLLESTTGRTWDAYACQDFVTRDIGQKAVRDFLGRAGMKKSTPLIDVMRNLRFGDETHFCNAAVLLFGKFPQRFFVEAKLKCARFIGTSSVNFLDERTIEGSILGQLDEAMSFVTRNTRQAIVITGKPAHDVVPEYPEEAVREAIINALCHRNYTEVGTIQVRIYDDRLEVWNPGKMPSDLSVAELYHQHASRPRNPLLANALFRARLIEQWGTGTLRIIEACRQHNIKVEFESAMGMFIVRLKKLSPPSAKPESQPESQPESRPESLNQRVLRLVKAMPLTKAKISAQLGQRKVSGQLNKIIRALVREGILEYTIPDKPNSRLQKYRLTERGHVYMKKTKGKHL